MRKPKPQEALYVMGAIVLFVALFRGWDSIINFVGILLTAIIPLVLGICVAYIVSIPTAFFERHLFPNSESGFMRAIRRPLALAISAFLTIVGVVLLVLVLAPAIVETAITARDGIREFLQYLMTTELFAPYRETMQSFLNGDVMADVDSLDIPSILKNFVGGTIWVRSAPNVWRSSSALPIPPSTTSPSGSSPRPRSWVCRLLWPCSCWGIPMPSAPPP